jgi:hypothetical protein
MNLSEERFRRLVRLFSDDPRMLKYLCLEAAWTAWPRRTRVLPLSWELPRDTLARTFIRWPTAMGLADGSVWEPKLKAALAAHVPIVPAPISQPLAKILVFDLVVAGRASRIALDYRDTHHIPEEYAGLADVYFKLQYSRDGYPWDNVLPGGYVVGRQKFYRYLAHLRSLAGRGPLFEVYGRFGFRREEVRRPIVHRLEEQELFDYAGGMGTVLYSQSLWELARAQIAVDLPGYGALCYRLVEALAIGSCIVALPHTNRLHVPLVPGGNILYFDGSGDDVVALCHHLIDHKEERTELARNARDYFDRYLHYRQLGAYYLSTVYERVLS